MTCNLCDCSLITAILLKAIPLMIIDTYSSCSGGAYVFVFVVVIVINDNYSIVLNVLKQSQLYDDLQST